MLAVNAWFAWKYFKKVPQADVDFMCDMDDLGLELLTNEFVEAKQTDQPAGQPDSTASECYLVLYSTLKAQNKKFKPGYQARCVICRHHASQYCAKCGIDCAVCSPSVSAHPRGQFSRSALRG